jgi:hypothetical protein
MAGAAGLEPTHAGVKVPCLTNLATPQWGFQFGDFMAGADGFEPPMRESESRALPLGHAPLRGGKFWGD